MRYFTRNTLDFLEDLKKNNNREWFNDNKSRYEAEVRTPALEFIEAIAPQLPAVSPYFHAIAKKTGGSLMRPYRDTRFSKDKTPYKTNIGIQFRHETGKDVHAPAYYLHIETSNIFVGAGMWHPESTALSKIRDLIVNDENAWLNIRRDKSFNNAYDFAGDCLQRPPRGFDKNHALIEDIKRKDFIGISPMSTEDIIGKNIINKVLKRYESASPLMIFLCRAQEVRF